MSLRHGKYSHQRKENAKNSAENKARRQQKATKRKYGESNREEKEMTQSKAVAIGYDH